MFILLFVLSVSYSKAVADTTSIEVLGGALTYHVLVGDSKANAQNAHKITSNGNLISNPEIGIAVTTITNRMFQSKVIFGGENSIGHSMSGALYERGVVYGNYQLGFVAGAYIQDDDAFRNLGVIPFRAFEFNGTGVVSVLGLTLNYQIVLSKNCYLKLNNIISPVITNTSISLGFNF